MEDVELSWVDTHSTKVPNIWIPPGEDGWRHFHNWLRQAKVNQGMKP